MPANILLLKMKVIRRYFNSTVKFTDDWVSDMELLFKLPFTHPNSPSNLVSVKGSSRRLNYKTQKGENKRRAAVLIPICNRNGLASVLFTVRTETVSTHKVAHVNNILMIFKTLLFFGRVKFHFPEVIEI